MSAVAPSPSHSGATAWPSRLAFAGAAAAVAALALRGGSYDIVPRQEAGLAAWWLLAIGLGLGLLPRSRPPAAVLLPLLALALLGAWTLAGLSWTDSQERTLAEGCRILGYLGMLVLLSCVLDRDTWRSAAAGLAAGALAVAALATVSRLAPELFPDDPVTPISGSRLNYPLNYWNAVGAWGSMAATAGLAWSVGATRPATRAAFLAAIPVAGLSIYLSYSRAAVAGLVAGVLCVLALSRRRITAAAHLAAAGVATAFVVHVTRGEPAIARGGDGSGAGTVVLALLVSCAACVALAVLVWRVRADERWRVPVMPARIAGIVAGLCLVSAGLLAGPGLAARAWDSFRDSGGETADLSSDPAQRLGSLHGSRHAVWSVALDTFGENGAHGTGAGTFEFAWNQAGRSPEFIRDAHSIYIEPLPELGWPGALSMAAFLLAVAGVSIRALRRVRGTGAHGAAVALVGVLAVYLVQAGVDWMWEMPAVTAMGIGGAAVLWTGLARPGPALRLPVAGRAAAVAACLTVCAVLLPGLVSSSLVRESQRSATEGDLREAVAEADDAVASAPWAATPRLQRGLALEAAGDPRAARADVIEAVEREPENWRLPLILARLEAELGRPSAAIRQFRRARRLRPRADVFQRGPVP